ncbi:SDR family NAD(P)-dependent oxidoreductase [Frankia tisae]|uniref:SDR family NAD(P)-dependent oxidoreductase n=1 Tax=Frankia tisae TaxID=2950104 RepID=UPI0021BDF61E|nr:SDR family oxidoreductase [Frankia tisae]
MSRPAATARPAAADRPAEAGPSPDPAAVASFDLHGRVSLVTGGNGGIGLGIAEALAAAGADVVILGTNERKNAAAEQTLAAHGGKVLALRCDVGDEAQVIDAFEQAVGAFGRIDSCFANAGIGGEPMRFTDLTLDQWHQVLRINLDGVFLTFRTAARHLVAAGAGGSLVAVSSIIGTNRGFARTQAYGTAKAALSGLVRSCAVELSRDGIRVNAILPGYIRTALADDLLDDEKFAARSLPRLLGRRWGTPADLGGIAVYLASEASRYQTGEQIVVDGGYILS